MAMLNRRRLIDAFAALALGWCATATAERPGLAAYAAGDYATAFAAWLPMAETGDLGAMYNVALLYDYGLGVEEDKAAAIRWYEPAALWPATRRPSSTSRRSSTLVTAFRRTIGKRLAGTPPPPRQADEQSQFNLGVMYANGEGVERSLEVVVVLVPPER